MEFVGEVVVVVVVEGADLAPPPHCLRTPLSACPGDTETHIEL